MLRNIFTLILTVMVIVVIGTFPTLAAEYKVLVVMGYHEDLRLSQELKAGIEETLGAQCEIQYAYLDVLRNPLNVDAKAEQAYAMYQEFQPDGVIAANDNTQSAFVVPYLKEKVDTPVTFAEVIAEPEAYGYPASNVSGILIRPFIKEAIIFVKQLVPDLNSVCLMGPDLPLVEAAYTRVLQERDEYQVTLLEPMMASPLAPMLSMIQERRDQCGALFIAPLYNKEETVQIIAAFKKATVTSKRELVEHGVLCGVVEQTREEGKLAAQMLLKAMQGTPMSELPITRNQYGQRLINVETMKRLNIKPTRQKLVGAELIKTVN